MFSFDYFTFIHWLLKYSHIKRILPKDVAWVVYDDERAHYYLIDVRSSEEYKKKRISGFLPYPFDQLEQKYVKLQEKDKRVFIHDDAVSIIHLQQFID